MKKVAKLANDSIYLELREVIKIGNKAVLHAKSENKKRGIPEVFSKNGTLYYLLPNGEVTQKRPQILCD